MTRKFDQPFVEVNFWIPFKCLELVRIIEEHPQFQVALRDALNQLLGNNEGGNPHG